jgi:hypothetical protein
LFERWKNQQQKWNKTLAALGRQVNNDEPDTLKHKYLTVQHWNLGA